jgi:hypothetical protein
VAQGARQGGRQVDAHKEIALAAEPQVRRAQLVEPDGDRRLRAGAGLRDIYQHADGYAANASRTFEVGIEPLFDAWTDPKARARWLPKAPLEVRRAIDGKSMRMTWTAGASRVEVNFFTKGAGRSQVQVEHGGCRAPRR